MIPLINRIGYGNHLGLKIVILNSFFRVHGGGLDARTFYSNDDRKTWT